MARISILFRQGTSAKRATFLATNRGCALLGADTMARIADLRFYESPRERDGSIDSLAEHGARFLVFG